MKAGTLQLNTMVASNLREAFVAYSMVCGEKVKRFPGITCVRHPSKGPAFNMAFLTDRAGLERNVLKLAQEFYRENGAEWCFIVPPHLADLFDLATRRIRISQRRATPEMILDGKGVPIPALPASLKIQPVKTLDGFRTWARTGALGFEDPANDFRFMVNRRVLEQRDFDCFLGYASGRPVATSVAYCSNGVTGILGVSTIPRARGRGYGEAMTWAAMRDGISKGCNLISLQASPLGFPIYHRMGFRHIFDFEEWGVHRDAPDVTI